MPVQPKSRRRTLIIAWVLSGLVLIPSVLSALPWELPSVAIMVLALLPWLLIPAALALGFALWSRQRAVSAFSALLLLAQLFWLFPLDANRGQDCQQAAGTVLPVMTLNARYGLADAAQIVDLLRKQGTGLLALQEFGGDLEERLNAAGITELLPYQLSSTVRGPGGSALYSKYPLEQLPAVSGTPHEMIRARLTLTTLPAKPVVELTNVHTMIPDSRSAERWRADLKALAGLPSNGANRLFLGDFNASVDHAEFRAFLASSELSDVGTISGQRFIPTFSLLPWLPPLSTLDHLAISPTLSATDYQVQSVKGSDHAAVLSSLKVSEHCG
ncbi:endonuclease/exonuclease/phosphatase family protein [Psychromicrobium sp. YIM B11713]|uniref:endonuclease/exonuclease/phosphatase family protein n=1 Tax=Psychromicrobium sp. YIM B11713 TaxID=3145233 RepID=UPI00374ED4B2